MMGSEPPPAKAHAAKDMCFLLGCGLGAWRSKSLLTSVVRHTFFYAFLDKHSRWTFKSFEKL